jgi:hypothetical protein
MSRVQRTQEYVGGGGEAPVVKPIRPIFACAWGSPPHQAPPLSPLLGFTYFHISPTPGHEEIGGCHLVTLPCRFLKVPRQDNRVEWAENCTVRYSRIP